MDGWMGSFLPGLPPAGRPDPGTTWTGAKLQEPRLEPALLWPSCPHLTSPRCQYAWWGGIYSPASSCGLAGPCGGDAVAQRGGHRCHGEVCGDARSWAALAAGSDPPCPQRSSPSPRLKHSPFSSFGSL